MYVVVYFVVIGYFLLAAISPSATVIPDTLPELARVAVLGVLAMFCWYWGRVSSPVLIIHERNPSSEGYDEREQNVT